MENLSSRATIYKICSMEERDNDIWEKPYLNP